MRCGIFYIKKRKIWVIKALDRTKNKMIAWVTGSCSAKTFRRLYEKLKHLKDCKFYTDHWDAFSKVLPKNQHIIGKRHTVSIEQDNSNIRNDLARFTRRTKVVSKSERMINVTLKLWQSLSSPRIFSLFQSNILSVFK